MVVTEKEGQPGRAWRSSSRVDEVGVVGRKVKLPGLMRRRHAEGALYSAAMLAGRSRIEADEG